MEEVNRKIAERRADRRAARNACNASEDMHHGYSITPQHTFQNELIKINWISLQFLFFMMLWFGILCL